MSTLMMSLPKPPALTPEHALFLDFDGTLVKLAEQPDAIRVSHSLPQILRGLLDSQEMAVAVVSGRSIEDLQRYLDVPGLSFAGVHGAEILRWGAQASSEAAQLPKDLEAYLRAQLQNLSGVLVEAKTYALAIHHRRAPQHAQRCLSVAEAVASGYGLECLPGNAVVELRRAGVDKGGALRKLMSAPPFVGRRPVMLGDDRTDEDAFQAARAMGGFGIRVGAERRFADYELSDVDAVHGWLQAQVQALTEAEVA